MRLIRFRGKRSNDNAWVYGYLLEKFKGRAIDQCLEFEKDGFTSLVVDYVHDDTVGQFTGLRDNNGKLIYEGDIIKVCPFEGCYHISEPTTFEILFEDGKFISKGVNNGATQLQLNHYSSHCEVIGNIFDNPELLEVKNV